MANTPRTPLKEREFPNYSPREEKANALSHAIGAALSVLLMVMAVRKAMFNPAPYALFSSIFYSISILLMFSVSSIYHGLPKGTAKQVMRVVDHCNIFLTIVGCYVPIMMVAVMRTNPAMARTVLTIEVVLAVIGVILNAIDLKKYSKTSMACYIAMGWCVIISLRATIEAMTLKGFLWILAGGIAYSIGAILYGVGKKKPYRHLIFHIFVIIAAILQYIGIYFFVL